MPVLDASVALSWLFERESMAERKRSVSVLDLLEETPATVPALWQAEILNGLLVGERRKLLTPSQAAEYIARLGQLPIVVDTVSPIARWASPESFPARCRSAAAPSALPWARSSWSILICASA